MKWLIRLSSIDRNKIELLSFIGLWMLFGLLVVNGIQGSSIPLVDTLWSQGRPDPEYVFGTVESLVEKGLKADLDSSDFLMKPRPIRSDEWLVSAPYALSQLAHDPKFPVINRNIGSGQNMLVIGSFMPVWHIVSLARPVTWGFLILGANAGLAWTWWFPLFSCFTALYFLGKIVFRSRALAALLGIWVCLSSFTLLWSVTPATMIGIAAIGSVSLYHIMCSKNNHLILVCSILLGLSIPAFIMLLYPAWQVPVTYAFLCIIVYIIFRDRSAITSPDHIRIKIICSIVSLCIASFISFSFINEISPALHLMTNTVYPGKRVSLGGDYNYVSLFRGFYNIVTNYNENGSPLPGSNQSELASFFLLSPPLAVATLIFPALRSKVSAICWLLCGYSIFILWYAFVGFPEWFAKITLFSFVPSSRAEIGLGFASIVMTLSIFKAAIELRKSGNAYQVRAARIASSLMGALLVIHAIILIREFGLVIPLWSMVAIIGIACWFVFLTMNGDFRRLATVLIISLCATSSLFNPLSRGIDYIYSSEIAQSIKRVDPVGNDDEAWACYGGNYLCSLVAVLGRNGINNVHWYPHQEIWNSFSPDVAQESVVNRYAHVLFVYNGDPNTITMNNPQPDVIVASIPPNSPVLKNLHVKYIIASKEFQDALANEHLSVLYKPADNSFTIFGLDD